MFKFKQFSIKQDKTAMKVGTDGVLLGAWVWGNNPNNILDIGAGTGLISIMMAQKFADSNIFAVEIEQNAYNQTIENIENSNWQNQISAYNDDFLNFASKTKLKFDIIVSNPPFFENQLLPTDNKILIAKHNTTLPFSIFIKKVAELLTKNGEFFVIIPFENHNNFVHFCSQNLLFCNQKKIVKHTHNTTPKRILLKFSKNITPIVESTLYIKKNAEYTTEYKQLTKDFYLSF